jgi:hypothetical protein
MMPMPWFPFLYWLSELPFFVILVLDFDEISDHLEELAHGMAVDVVG